VKGSSFANKKDRNKEKNNATTKDSSSSSSSSTASCSLVNGSTGVGGAAGGSGGSGGVSSSGSSAGSTSGVSSANGLDLFAQGEPRIAVEAMPVKMRDVIKPVDPYEFNAKVEDGLCLPPKKLKTDTKVIAFFFFFPP
jgi:hypothetical protein